MIRGRVAVSAAALVTVLVAVPSEASASGLTPPVVSVSCSPAGPAGACSGWFHIDVDVAFSWTVPAGETFWSESGCNGFAVTQDTAGLPYSCTVTLKDASGATVSNAPLSGSIERDTTPPAASAIAANRPPDDNGWYNHPLGVSVSGSDPTSGIASCTSLTYSGPDSSSTSVTGSCTDNAGNRSAPVTLTFKYDATPPSIVPAPSRNPDANGWYNHPLDVSFTGSDATSGIANCSSTSYSGPDAMSGSVGGTCSDEAGNIGATSFPLKYDATPPEVTGATPDRPPDSNGWYNHKVVITFAGADSASGISSCDVVTYDHPDSPSAKVQGQCRDNAGNVALISPFVLKYDSSPPKLTGLAADPLDGSVSLTWKPSADVASLVVMRHARAANLTTVYSGKRITGFIDKKLHNGIRYTYTVVAVDAAGNTATEKAVVVPTTQLLAPRQQAKVHGFVILRWRDVPHATYYNLQLWAASVKVLSVWPSGTSFRVPTLWTYRGRSYRLLAGRYKWLVWPGRGSRTAGKYGHLLGTSSFVVTP